MNKKLLIPFLAALAGVLVMVTSLFLPYLSATGEMAEYIQQNPDRMEDEEKNLTAGELERLSMLTVNKIVSLRYTEADAVLAKVIVAVLAGFTALTGLFVLLKKPIPGIVFNLLAAVTFGLLNLLLKADFVSPDTYAWGSAYYTTWLSAALILAGCIWMLVQKIAGKTLSATPSQTEITGG